MPSERIQRQIDRLLDEIETAVAQRDWVLVRQHCQVILRLDPENEDACGFLAAAEREPAPLVGARFTAPVPPLPLGEGRGEGTPAAAQPTSFANGRYQVKRFLGEGGKKRVYLAHDTLLDRDVAFALIKTEGLDDAGRQRLTREAQAMGRLGDHPHIVAVYDLGQEPPLPLGEGRGEGRSQPFIVTQLMAGGDVEGLIEEAPEHRPALARTLEIGQQVCRGLEYAHGHGIVHRDLKPGNVWLTADGTAKLGDFGLAVALDRSRLTQQGMMVGTVSYMPPEQAMGGEVTPRSDLYSLGAMLYEMVTGRPPFIGDESVAIITQHLNVPPVLPSWHRPDCPPALEALILRLLEKDPSKRPASASEVLAALGHVDLSPNLSPSPFPAREGEPGPGDRSSVSPFPRREGGREDRSAGPGGDNPIYRRAFVGREQELRQIQNAFDGAISGQGALMTVVGEPGIGKTALCEQLATYVAIRGGKALVGHSYEEGSLSLPYLPFVEALRSYVLAREPEQLRSELGSGAADVARIVSEIREKVQVSERPAGDPEDERYRLYQALTGFLRNAAAVQPLVIVLEDLHWADGGTLDFLLHLSRNLQGTRLLIVGTYRDVEVDRAHPLSGALAELRRGSSFARVVLRGLTVDEVHRMINALHGQEVRWSLAEAIHRQTEGNPLFIQEVLRFMVEEGLITHEGGRWHRAGETPPELGIPEGLRDVIGKRLSRLSPECNRLLAIAAVIGRDFDLAILRRVAETDEEALTQALEEALKVGVLEEQARLARLQYRFTHAFFRQTLYEEMSGPRRLRWHQQVARALEAQYPNRLEEHAAEMAEHFAQSTDPADLKKAIHYGELAASKAMSVFAYGEAVRVLERAIEVQEVLDPDNAAKRCDLLLTLGAAQMPLGEPKRVADEAAEEAYGLAEMLRDPETDTRPDPERASRACRLALEGLHRWAANTATFTPEWRRWAERADRCAPPGGVYRAYADLALARVRMAAGEYGEGIALCRRGLDLARDLDDPELFFAAGWQFILQTETPARWREAVAVADELLARPRDGASARTLSQAAEFSGRALLLNGDRTGAESCWREMGELAQRSRDTSIELNAGAWQAASAYMDGRLEESAEAGRRLANQAQEAGVLIGSRRLRSAWAFRHLGLTAQQVLAAGLLEQGWASHAVPLLAELGRREEAEQLLQRQLTRQGLSDHGDAAPVFNLLSALEGALILEDRESAAILSKHLASAAPTVYYSLCTARLLGAAAALLGEREQANAYYEQALEVCQRVRHRPELALTHLQMAELLLDSGPVGAQGLAPLQTQDTVRADALVHLDFAIAEFREMKMQPALERALRHKDVLKA